MTLTSHLLCIALLVACPGVLSAEKPHGDLIHANLFSPEKLMQHRATIGLTDQQLTNIRELVEDTSPKIRQHQSGLQDAMKTLAELLAAEKVDEEAALKQLDKVLGIEKEVKHAHFRVMIRIRNELTADQQRIAAKLKQAPSDAVAGAKGLEQRLKAKIAQIQKAAQARAEAGESPRDALEQMQKLPELMQRGKVQEAEALLNRVLKMLGVEGSDEPADEPKRSAQSSRLKSLPKLEPLSLDAVRAEVAALKKEDVAWRKIEWITCLIDGLNASRAEQADHVVGFHRPADRRRALLSVRRCRP